MHSGYMHLQTLWFALIAILWIGYFVLEGFDFGVGMLLPFVSRDDADRRSVINTIGPVWDGNEVWLIVAGGATFAAFPDWYATLFSGFYMALLLILVSLIVRGVAFEWRGKRDTDTWRAWWDRAIFVGSALPALLWGVAFANLLQGVPIDRSGEFTGDFFTLLNPYSLIGGVTSLTLFLLHGGCYLQLKATGDVAARARRVAEWLSIVVMALVLLFLVWTYLNAESANNKGSVPGVVPITAMLLAVALPFLTRRRVEVWTFLTSTAVIGLVTATIFLNLYPRVMVSSTNKAFDLTVWNSSSTHYTLAVMTVVALVMTPVVVMYQAWSYHVFRHRISRDDVGPPPSPIDMLAPKKPRPSGD